MLEWKPISILKKGLLLRIKEQFYSKQRVKSFKHIDLVEFEIAEP
jgi:hypothetical protein